MSKIFVSLLISLVAIIGIYKLTKKEFYDNYKTSSILNQIENESKDISVTNQSSIQYIDSLQIVIDSVNTTIVNHNIAQNKHMEERLENYQNKTVQDFIKKKEQLRQEVIFALKTIGNLKIDLNCIHVAFWGSSNDRAAMDIYLFGRHIASPSLNENNRYSYSKQLFNNNIK